MRARLSLPWMKPRSPFDILSDAARDAARLDALNARIAELDALNQREYGLRVPTVEEETVLMREWETDRESTQIALNAQMLYGQQFDTLHDEDWRDIAKAIKRYGDERAESAIERYQEWGE